VSHAAQSYEVIETMFGLGTQDMFVLLILGVLFFGKRLPEVGRSAGRMLMEFKNSVRGVQDELTSTFRGFDLSPTPPPARKVRRIAPTAPKFTEPPEPV
jgi:sec-independent protein translocase protein TatA